MAGLDPTKQYRLLNLNSGRAAACAGAGTTPNTHLIQYSWSPGSSQQWLLVPLPGGDAGFYRLQPSDSRASGLALSVASGTTGPNPLILWGWNSTSDQKWRLVEAGSSTYVLLRMDASQRLAIGVSDKALGDNAWLMQQPLEEGAWHQRWYVTAVP